MNKIIIKGRLCKDVELKATATGKEVANFSVAVNRRFDKENSDFFDVQAWGKTGVFVNTYFKKGQEIIVSGEMHCRKWQDKEGNNRYSWELVADEVDFCGSKQAEQASAAPSEPAPVDDFAPVDDADLPF